MASALRFDWSFPGGLDQPLESCADQHLDAWQCLGADGEDHSPIIFVWLMIISPIILFGLYQSFLVYHDFSIIVLHHPLLCMIRKAYLSISKFEDQRGFDVCFDVLTVVYKEGPRMGIARPLVCAIIGWLRARKMRRLIVFQCLSWFLWKGTSYLGWRGFTHADSGDSQCASIPWDQLNLSCQTLRLNQTETGEDMRRLELTKLTNQTQTWLWCRWNLSTVSWDQFPRLGPFSSGLGGASSCRAQPRLYHQLFLPNLGGVEPV